MYVERYIRLKLGAGPAEGDFRVPKYIAYILATRRLQSYWSQRILNQGYYTQN